MSGSTVFKFGNIKIDVDAFVLARHHSAASPPTTSIRYEHGTEVAIEGQTREQFDAMATFLSKTTPFMADGPRVLYLPDSGLLLDVRRVSGFELADNGTTLFQVMGDQAKTYRILDPSAHTTFVEKLNADAPTSEQREVNEPRNEKTE